MGPTKRWKAIKAAYRKTTKALEYRYSLECPPPVSRRCARNLRYSTDSLSLRSPHDSTPALRSCRPKRDGPDSGDQLTCGGNCRQPVAVQIADGCGSIRARPL